MRKFIATLLATVTLLGLLTGCSATGEYTLKYGQSQTIQLPKEYDALTRESSAPEIVQVSGGTITGVAPGNAVVTALSGKKTVGSYTVTVELVAITQLYLQAEEMTLKFGDSAVLGYTLFPQDASDYGLSYTSINPEIATVDQAGNITSVAPGTTTIVLSTQSGITASCQVTVEDLSPIEQLNDEEKRLFDYLTEDGLSSFYNASAACLRGLYAIKAKKEDYEYSASSLLVAKIQGTNRLGGTLYKYYMMSCPSDGSKGYMFACADSFYPDSDYIEFPIDIIDYAKINAALDEYWGVVSVAK